MLLSPTLRWHILCEETLDLHSTFAHVHAGGPVTFHGGTLSAPATVLRVVRSGRHLDTVLAGCEDGSLAAVDPSTLQPLWRYTLTSAEATVSSPRATLPLLLRDLPIYQ